MTGFAQKYNRLLAEWFRFVIVGIGATVTYLIVSLMANSVAIDVYWANLAGYLASVAISYLGHSHITFRSSQPHRIQGPKFAIVSLMTYGLTNLIVFIAIDLLEQTFLKASLAVAFSIPIVTWFLARYWVFRSR